MVGCGLSVLLDWNRLERQYVPVRHAPRFPVSLPAASLLIPFFNPLVLVSSITLTCPPPHRCDLDHIEEGVFLRFLNGVVASFP